MRILRYSLIIGSLIGFFVCSITMGLTYSAPNTIERIGKGFIKFQIEQELRNKFHDVQELGYVQKIARIKKKYIDQTQDAQQSFKKALPEKIATVIASMCRLDCEAKNSIQTSIVDAYKHKIWFSGLASDQLTRIIQAKYIDIVDNLEINISQFLHLTLQMQKFYKL